MSNANKKVINMNKAPEAPMPPKYPELFTDPEIVEYADDIICTTEAGCVFVKKEGKVYLFQPVAALHGKEDEYYYTKVDFK